MARKVVSIGDVLGPLLKRLGLERRLREARIALEWDKIVGEKVAAHSRPVALKGKTLVVNVDSSVWLSELSHYFKGKILEKIHDEMGEKRIRDIRFRIGEISDAQV